ncbi:hypothetical protein SAY87_016176 [Trapa incisa]|uniref:Uncharacterized protein n=1 Tax=Trapa incisa TaxID=236973 RepID=A0AAN7LEW4_9MYRT|nr:hypothetical protein SAY87_016176 [Trapa incisa]
MSLFMSKVGLVHDVMRLRVLKGIAQGASPVIAVLSLIAAHDGKRSNHGHKHSHVHALIRATMAAAAEAKKVGTMIDVASDAGPGAGAGASVASAFCTTADATTATSINAALRIFIFAAFISEGPPRALGD